VAPGPGADDGLTRWAATRAPSLLARGETEAVAVLRDALVIAANGTCAPLGGDEVAPESEVEQGELLWAYGVVRTADAAAADLSGMSGVGRVHGVQSGDITALVSAVPRAEFGAGPLRRTLNDMRWLERVARAHESVLDATLQTSTIVPLRMCALYDDHAAVRRMLEHEREAFAQALKVLDGRLEWAVKVLVDEERLMRLAQARCEQARALEREHEGHGEDGTDMLRRRLEHQVRDAAKTLATEVAQHVHARLEEWTLDAVTHPPQNRELSGHHAEMVLNGAYLVERERIDELRELVRELEAHHAELGIRIELTGPWPPYNFVFAGSSSAIS
jgi:Gas vesicle synthesis protein GvpL/GvpF